VNSDIDAANRSFWDELCGTQLARSLGVTDDSTPSLARFDEWYFGFYPYLEEEIPFDSLSGKRVLEVGLGYGTVSGRLIQAGAHLCALDIAQGPVQMVRHRAALQGRDCEATVGSILDAPYPADSFDAVIGIGSYHHTGDTPRALDETHRVLRPGGTAFIMVYNAYSYRRWTSEPGETLRYLLADKLGRGSPAAASARARAQYDVNSRGESAPHTDFFSVSAVRRLCAKWSAFAFRRRNIGAEGPLRYLARDTAMRAFAPLLGLDLYFRIRK